MVDREPRVISDIEALKALAHPLRQRMLARLQQRGSATSADLAVECGVDRGAASYHLRQLERFGFVEDDDARSGGRRRYWRSVPQDMRLPTSADGSEVAAVAREIGRQWLERSESDLHAYVASRESFGEFADAAMHSYGGTSLTAEELARFGEEYVAFLKRWHHEPGAGRRHVTVVFHAFPTPEPR